MIPYQRAQQRFKGKNVLIMGLGLLGGGVGDTRFFCDLGANVRVTDQKNPDQLQSSVQALSGYPIEFFFGDQPTDSVQWADFIVRNPSVPETHPLLVEAERGNKTIIMRSSLFCELSQVPVIGITGTRGKTTTTMMIYALAQALSEKKVLLGGNIAGISDLELIKEIEDPNEYLAVMELSSWQLQGFAKAKLSPHISVITNLYPDHQNRYPSLQAYYQDKRNIITHQSDQDFAVLNESQSELHEWATKIASQTRWFSASRLPETVLLQVPGEHNCQNAAAALEVGKILGYSEVDCVSVLNNFHGVPYRLETIAKKNQVTYINDTTSTTPTAGEVALMSCPNPPILILGGADKNLPLETYATAINIRTKFVILLPGSGTDRIKPLIVSTLIRGEAVSMKEAVGLAEENASAGDTVLLSPGFASFGLFNNEFDRGDQFNQCVQELP